MKKIVLAGGCFWGMEALYRRIPGVVDVTVGYANGKAEKMANYAAVCTGLTGFREAAEIVYDPELTPLSQLLFIFFAVIDPEVRNRQGRDMGSQYQTGVYWSDPADEAVVRSLAEIEAAAHARFWVELKPLENFYPAEAHHQRYLERFPDGYCHIEPRKIRDLARYPFEEAAYTRPAREMLEAWMIR